MEHVELKCKNCGSDLTIQPDGTYICAYCGSKYEKNQDNIQYVNNNIQNITKNIYSNERDIDDYLKNGETFLSLDEWEKAEEAFNKAVDLDPADCRGWFGLVKVYTGDLTMAYPHYYEEPYIKAMRVAGPEDRATMFEIMQDYYKRVKGNLYPYDFPDDINFMDKNVLKRRYRISKPVSDKRINRYSIFTILLGVIFIIIGIAAGLCMMMLPKSNLTLENDFSIKQDNGTNAHITGVIRNSTGDDVEDITIVIEVANAQEQVRRIQINIDEIDENESYRVSADRNIPNGYDRITSVYYMQDNRSIEFNNLTVLNSIIVLGVIAIIGIIVLIIGIRLPNYLEKRNTRIIDRAQK